MGIDGSGRNLVLFIVGFDGCELLVRQGEFWECGQGIRQSRWLFSVVVDVLNYIAPYFLLPSQSQENIEFVINNEQKLCEMGQSQSSHADWPPWTKHVHAIMIIYMIIVIIVGSLILLIGLKEGLFCRAFDGRPRLENEQQIDFSIFKDLEGKTWNKFVGGKRIKMWGQIALAGVGCSDQGNGMICCKKYQFCKIKNEQAIKFAISCFNQSDYTFFLPNFYENLFPLQLIFLGDYFGNTKQMFFFLLFTQNPYINCLKTQDYLPCPPRDPSYFPKKPVFGRKPEIKSASMHSIIQYYID